MKPRHTYRGVVLRGASAAARARTAPASATLPTPGRVRVGREVAGRSGKGVTVISGLSLDPARLDELAARLKKLCGAGGAVKNGRIEIQGDHRDRLVAELCQLGFEAKRSGG
ncbi:MAG TPA: stress response translation initiation inhibitor YciH [Steroidobacteraceae bacterium]|jgi:translation initiation factor 1|nr:stress response translation initiation inhibitor YciH [Steroidobacteraceae bacterium]